MRTLVEILGAAAVVAGVAFIFWPAALIIGGLMLVLGANAQPAAGAD